jgi:hypothetical protein
VEIIAVALASIAAGVFLALMTGQPLAFLVAVIVGALIANRMGYRHQARAVALRAHRWGWVQPNEPATRTVEQRLAEIARLRSAGTITEQEHAERRKAILSDL